MKGRVLLAATAALALAGAARAAADDGECRNGGFPMEQDSFGLARVAGAGRLRFLRDMGGCPNVSTACLGVGYVLPGDEVITGRTRGPYVCVFFAGRGGVDSAGWVERARLTPEPTDAAPPPSAWTGRWRDGDDVIRLSAAAGGTLKAKGEAYWPAADPRSWPGGPHIGSLEASGRSRGAELHLEEGDEDDACRVDLRRVGPFLVARDNMKCGGMNVRFTGVYRRR